MLHPAKMEQSTNMKKLRLLELFSGIGGLRYAIEAAHIPYELVAAIDIDPVANEVYSHNFGKTAHFCRNVKSLTRNEVEYMDIDIIAMSPPCDPGYRIGSKKNTKDPRCSAFLHILNIITLLQKKPAYILLENVKDYETYDEREKLIETLETCGYNFQEFVLSPEDFGVPNYRPRYCIIAKLGKFRFSPSKEVISELPGMHKMGDSWKEVCSKCQEDNHSDCVIKHFLEEKCDDYFEKFLLPDDELEKHDQFINFAGAYERASCIFTKKYTCCALRAGSILYHLPEPEGQKMLQKLWATSMPEKVQIGKYMRLRYFTPKEVSNILCFPTTFDFPDHLNLKQKYQVIGNAPNIFVLSRVLPLLFEE